MKRRSPVRFVRSALLALASTLPAACGRTGASADAARPIEVVVPNEISTLDPRFAARSLDVKVSRLVHAGLVGLDPDTLEPVPMAAESLRWVDAVTLDVTLKRGVRFHGGKLLSPEDVCATIAAVKDPAVASPHRAVVEAIGRCSAEGEHSVRFVLGSPRATLVTDLELPILRADQVRKPPSLDGSLDGLGPFAVQSMSREEVLLVPATTGVVPRPAHAVVVRTVRDENARAQRLLAGRSDVAPNGISPTLLPALEGRDGLSVVSHRGANVTYLLFQNDRSPFSRREVRHAVLAGLDRALVTRTLLGGRAIPAATFLPPGHWAAPAFPVEPYDPERARPVLTGLGPVTLLTSTERARVTVARALAQMLGDVGLSVAVVPLDLGVMLARLDAGDFDLAVLQIPEMTEPNVLSWFFHPKGVPNEGGMGKNRVRYRNPLAGTLLDAASETVDREARRRSYADFLELLRADLPALPLWHEDQIAVVSARARGFRPSAEGRWLSLARLE